MWFVPDVHFRQYVDGMQWCLERNRGWNWSFMSDGIVNPHFIATPSLNFISANRNQTICGPHKNPFNTNRIYFYQKKNITWSWKQQWDSVNQWICRSFVLCFHATGVNHKLEKVWREFSNIVSVPLLFYFDLLSLIDHCFLLFDILLFSFYLDLLPLIRATVCYFLGDLRRKRI